MDKLSIYKQARWVVTVLVILAFIGRVVYAGGYHVVSYVLGIYVLNLFIGFMTPSQGDLEDEENDEPVLPTKEADEYKPFIRKVPEYRFWQNFTLSFIVGFVCTFFEVFDVPVFWPILLIYFIFLLIFTLRR